MQYITRHFFMNAFLALFLFSVAGCGSSEEEIRDDYNGYTFDTGVIEKLPLYDSLVSAIIENYASFKKYIRDEDGHRAFRYMPATDDPDVFIKLPPEAAPKIDPYYTRLGKDLIYAFDVFKDSSVKIYVRTRFNSKSQVDIGESLSYYPAGNIRRREFPDKDSILNKNWQYWARFSKRGLF